MGMTNSQKKKHNPDNIIPNYDHLFGEGEKPEGRRTGFVRRVLGAHRGRLAISLLVYIVKASPVWIVPILTSKIIDLANGVNSTESLRQILFFGVILALLLLQNVPMHVLYARLTDTMMRSISAGLKSAMVRKLQRLSITYHKQIETGRLQSKFLRDMEAIDGMLGTLVRSVVPAIIGVLISIGISTYNSPLMTLFFLVVIPLNILLTKLFQKKIRAKNREYRMEIETVSSRFTSMLEMLPVTKAHGLEKEEINGFDSEVRKLTSKGLGADRTNAYFGSWVWVLSNLVSGLCLVVCAVLALNGKISVGNIVLYQSLFASINGNVSTIVNVFPALVAGLESVTSVAEVMVSDDVERLRTHTLPEIKGEVCFDHVYYSYPDDPASEVIHDLNLSVHAGECIAFVGSSGSGKSTVMNLIIGFLTATKGKLTIDGEDINDISLPDYRHHISVVPQNSILFPGTIRENITYGLPQYREEDLQRVLEMANINEFLDQLPCGLDSPVGESGGKLSGGQKQRITIARALIRDPRILILDEATSALDNVSEFHVQKAINQSIKGRTTFIVAHRLSTIRNADRIVVMDAGRPVECGTYDELMALQGKFFELKQMSDITYKQVESLD